MLKKRRKGKRVKKKDKWKSDVKNGLLSSHRHSSDFKSMKEGFHAHSESAINIRVCFTSRIINIV